MAQLDGSGYFEVELLQTVGSTNDYLKSRCDRGRPLMVVAQSQSQGRGRRGRFWHSPAGEGLYVSYLFYPNLSSQQASVLTMVSALAVVKVLEGLAPRQCRISIKLPNDILLEGGKVCGILTELATLGDRVSWAILGVGVNVLQHRFPGDLTPKATSLWREGFGRVAPTDLCRSLTAQLVQFLAQLDRGAFGKIEEQFNQVPQLQEYPS